MKTKQPTVCKHSNIRFSSTIGPDAHTNCAYCDDCLASWNLDTVPSFCDVFGHSFLAEDDTDMFWSHEKCQNCGFDRFFAIRYEDTKPTLGTFGDSASPYEN